MGLFSKSKCHCGKHRHLEDQLELIEDYLLFEILEELAEIKDALKSLSGSRNAVGGVITFDKPVTR